VNPPSVEILSPASASVFAQGSEVFFQGSATDPEAGDVSASLVWSSQKDGVIGTGPSFALATLSKGKHNVTATATDPDGNAASAVVSIHVRR
jgi:hypothetical protein